jgi:hypothetical protein
MYYAQNNFGRMGDETQIYHFYSTSDKYVDLRLQCDEKGFEFNESPSVVVYEIMFHT